jgi:hypothetical protein
MGLFGGPDVAKLKAKGDVGGLIKLLSNGDHDLPRHPPRRPVEAVAQ